MKKNLVFKKSSKRGSLPYEGLVLLIFIIIMVIGLAAYFLPALQSWWQEITGQIDFLNLNK